jgi:hypothetical protein
MKDALMMALQVATGGGGEKPVEAKGEYLKDPLYGGNPSRNIKEHTMDTIIDVLSDYRSQELYGRKVDKNEIRSIRFSKLKDMYGPEKAAKLFTQLELFKQDERYKQLPFEEKLNAFVSTLYSDKDVSAIVEDMTSRTSYSVVDHWRGSSVLNPDRTANHFDKGDGSTFTEEQISQAINNAPIFQNIANRLKQ